MAEAKPIDDPMFLAAIDLIRRTGAQDVRIGFYDDEPPTIWHVTATYGADHPVGPAHEVAAAMSPKRREDRPAGGGGYRQEAAAGIALDYYSMRERAEHYTGLAAILADFDHGMEKAYKDAPDGYYRLVRCMEREDQPDLVDSLPALSRAILEAHRASSHEAQWEVDGKMVWVPLQALLRMEEDTIAVRSVASRMKWGSVVPKPKQERIFLTGVGAARRDCDVCGVKNESGRVWRDLDRDVAWCEKHGREREVAA